MKRKFKKRSLRIVIKENRICLEKQEDRRSRLYYIQQQEKKIEEIKQKELELIENKLLDDLKIKLKRIKNKSKKILTRRQYNLMLAYQHNRCAICHNTFTNAPNIDHDHETGKIRGLLCRSCNFGIGFLKDNITILNNAIEYLEKGPSKYSIIYPTDCSILIKPLK